jgi:RNA polymerase sigma factor (sigma-70 family)
LSDKDIIAGCLRNDRYSQMQLFDKYKKSMKSLCLRYLGDNEEADDVLQEGFILMFDKLNSYKFEGSFEGWLRRIMTNICLKHLIEKKKFRIENIEDTTDLKEEFTDIESDLTTKELMSGLMKLPYGYRTVFNMYVIEGYSHKEIGDKLKIEESSSRSQLAKAKVFLRKILKDRDFI